MFNFLNCQALLLTLPEHAPLLTRDLTAVQLSWVGPGGEESRRNLRIWHIPLIPVFFLDHYDGSVAFPLTL